MPSASPVTRRSDKFLAKGLNLLDRCLEAFTGARHPAFVPNDLAEAFVEGPGGLRATYEGVFRGGF